MDKLDPTLHYSPYFAGFEGKTPEQARVLEDRIDALPEEAKDLLFAPSAADRLEEIADQNHVPQQYALALGKVFFLTILGDVPAGSIGQLLGKLGLEPAQASGVGNGISELLNPLITARGKVAAAPQGMQEMPVLNRPTETGPRPIAGQQGDARNIIDLRKQQPNA